MGRKGKVSFEEKTRIVEMYLNGICSQEDCARIAGVTKTSVQQWIRKYETFGIEGLNTKIKHKKYTRDL
ncbi:Helix-turn-helix domain-containing protein, partial [Dethiosulfatibacter aminovorans DSM 17477]